jgi:predicted amino acid-binding ACT domain protein
MNLAPRRRRRGLARGMLSREHRAQIDAKRASTLALLTDDPPVVPRVSTAPVGYLLAIAGSDIARQCALLEPLPSPGEVRAVATPGRAPGSWHLDLATRDRPGLLAAFTGVLADAAVDVAQAVVATWPDGAALQALVVRCAGPPDASELLEALTASLDAPVRVPPVADASITFDQLASPLYTACQVEAPDHPGLLHAIASAIAATGTDIHAASVTTVAGVAQDRFDLTDRDGRKVDPVRQRMIQDTLHHGLPRRDAYREIASR